MMWYYIDYTNKNPLQSCDEWMEVVSWWSRLVHLLVVFPSRSSAVLLLCSFVLPFLFPPVYSPLCFFCLTSPTWLSPLMVSLLVPLGEQEATNEKRLKSWIEFPEPRRSDWIRTGGNHTRTVVRWIPESRVCVHPCTYVWRSQRH